MISYQKNANKKMFTLILIGLSSLIQGCAQIEKWQASKSGSEKRVFATRKVWVRQGTSKVNTAYRKINRMKPLAFLDLIISANAIDGIVAFNKDSGQEVWRTNITNGVEASGTLINDRLFVGGNDGYFYAINAKTGSVLWTFPTRIETLAEPLLEEGILYFLTGNNTLYALDAASGKQLWLYSRPDASSLSIRGGSKPAYRNGTLYVGFSDGSIVALLAKTGTVKWEKQLNKNKKFRDLDTNPLIEGDYIYLLGFDDAIYCLRVATGEQAWRSDRGGYGSPLIVSDRIFYATSTNEFVALNKANGEKLWSYTLRDGISTSPSLYKGLVVFGESQGSLVFLDIAHGKKVGSFEPGRGVFSQIAVDEKDSRIYFTSNEANVYALEARWTFPQHIPYLQ
jgi:outer membrane protein assembly factor BamB